MMSALSWMFPFNVAVISIVVLSTVYILSSTSECFINIYGRSFWWCWSLALTTNLPSCIASLHCLLLFHLAVNCRLRIKSACSLFALPWEIIKLVCIWLSCCKVALCVRVFPGFVVQGPTLAWKVFPVLWLSCVTCRPTVCDAEQPSVLRRLPWQQLCTALRPVWTHLQCRFLSYYLLQHVGSGAVE